MSAQTKEQFADHFLDARTGPRDTPLSVLSRELQVFRLIGGGRKNRESARTLQVSVRTIEAHRAHIMRKLELQSSAALNRVAANWVEGELTPR